MVRAGWIAGVTLAGTLALAAVPTLRRLEVRGAARLDDALLAALGRAPALEQLVLSGELAWTVTVDGCAALARAPRLERLRLESLDAPLPSACLSALAPLPLRALEVFCDRVRADDLAALPATVEALDLGAATLDDDAFAGCSHLVRLETLSVTGQSVADFAPLRTLPRLHALELGLYSGSRTVNARALAAVAALSTLDSLTLNAGYDDDPADSVTAEQLLACLSHLPKLRALDLGNWPASDELAESLTSVRPDLERLSVLHLASASTLTDQGLLAFAGFRSVEGSGGQVTPAGVEALRARGVRVAWAFEEPDA